MTQMMPKVDLVVGEMRFRDKVVFYGIYKMEIYLNENIFTLLYIDICLFTDICVHS